MTVNEFIEQLQKLREDLKEKEIIIYASNGLEFNPKIKFQKREENTWNHIQKVVITY